MGRKVRVVISRKFFGRDKICLIKKENILKLFGMWVRIKRCSMKVWRLFED